VLLLRYEDDGTLGYDVQRKPVSKTFTAPQTVLTPGEGLLFSLTARSCGRCSDDDPAGAEIYLGQVKSPRARHPP